MKENWRSLPSARYSFKGGSDSELRSFYVLMVVSLNLALYKTYRGKQYKKFAVLISTIEDEHRVFNLYCHDAEFIANFKQIVDGSFELKESLLKEVREKQFLEIIKVLPNKVKFKGVTIVYDEQSRKMALGAEPLQMPATTSSGLLCLLETMLTSDIISDDSGLLFDFHPLSKLLAYTLDNDKIDFSRIKINPANNEEWDYYYPKYDKEIEDNLKSLKLGKEKEPKPEDENEFIDTITLLLNNFKVAIENYGYRLISDNGKPGSEKKVQTAFLFYFKEYCKTLNIDVTKESDTGRGPVDFRFSNGVDFISHIEIKKDSHPKIKDSLKKQLKTYMDSEKVRIGFLIIVDFGEKDLVEELKTLKRDKINLEKEGKYIEIIVVDARKKKSASKL